MSEITIIPTLFAKEVEEFKKEYEMLKPYFFYFHIDIADGNFVSSKTLALDDISFINKENKEFEVHLMCSNPSSYMKKCESLGISKVFIHYEVFSSQKTCLDEIKKIEEFDLEIGIVANPETPIEELFPLFRENVSCVMLMAVHPGSQGQEFIESTYEKIVLIREQFPDVLIQVDGGIKPEIAKKLVERGANYLCVGSYLNKAEDIVENYKKLIQEL